MNAYRGASKRGYLYVQATGARKLRACGTADRHIVRAMRRMLAELRGRRAWDLLEAVLDDRITLGQLYDAYALQRLEGLRAELAAVDLVPHVDAWIAYYLASGRSATNAPIYRAQVLSLLGERCLSSELTPARVMTWLQGLTITSGAKRNRLMALRSFVRYCVQRGVLATNPIREVEAPKKNPPSLRYESPTVDAAIVAHARTAFGLPMAALFAFVHATGADLSPVLQHTLRGDLDLTRGVARLRGTKHAKRHVHDAIIDPWALPILREYLATMLPTVRPWATIDRYQAAKAHQASAVACAVPGYTLRMARHTWAVAHRRAGDSLEAIAAQLGNSVYQVATVYARFTPTIDERLRDAMATDLATSPIQPPRGKRA